MHELQATFIENKLFLWGISSNPDEVFTPLDKLEKIYDELFLSKVASKKTYRIEMPAAGDALVVPPSMKLSFNQFDVKKAALKIFSVGGIEICAKALIQNFVHPERRHGFLFGDSFMFFENFLRFAFSLVSRQRFVPYFIGNQSCFLPNLDNPDDYEAFQDFCNIAPLSIKPAMEHGISDILSQCLGYFINVIIEESLNSLNLSIRNETKTDEWLLGLIGKKGKISSIIKDELTRWGASRRIDSNIGYHMLFRLEEPSDGSNNWQIAYCMQSRKDLSLIISLDEVWGGAEKLPVKNAKVHLLQELGTAAKASKAIEKSLYMPNPSGTILSHDEAMEFMVRDSFLLKDAGFAVQIPKITFAKLNSLKVMVKLKGGANGSSKLKVEGTGLLGRALFDFDYRVAMGELDLSREEFYELAKCKEKLVNVKGRWVEVNGHDIKKVIDFFEKKKKLSIADVIAANASENALFEISDTEAPERFKAEIRGLFNFKEIGILSVPENFSGSLRPYQVEGVSWMAFLRNLGFGGILADDMGLGKTIQAIAYFLSCGDKPSLIIAPTSVLGNWERELHKFSPSLKAHMHHGAKRLAASQFAREAQHNDVVISSYAIARRDEDILSSMEWGNVILDEAQNIKNPYTKQAAAISRLKSRNRFCLTGTPIENRLSEFWSIMNFCNPGFLSSWESFKKNFAEPIELENDAAKMGILKRIITPFILRRLKTDKQIINDLPDKTEIKEYCKLTKEQATLYQAVVDDSMEKIEMEKENRRALIMAALIKLKQVCNHPANYLKDSARLLERSGKVIRLRELVDVFLQNNEKCLIFTQYKEMGDLLKSDLEEHFDAPVGFFHGQQSRKEREQLIGLFQSDDKASPKILILSLKAGGLGINLTKASQVVHFDRWWNPAVEAQATDRAYRIGQTKNVLVYKFITSGTVEEKIDEMIERKLALSSSLLSKGEISITELNNEKLRELFSLRKECLEETEED